MNRWHGKRIGISGSTSTLVRIGYAEVLKGELSYTKLR
ncbi:hypothetical protein EVA_20824 [gut metagenome]|uniref:Uncharacterized protein n=1 Tax=gut metagenome TaxID=749906 RepID=J9FUQ9_9ZZZZ